MITATIKPHSHAPNPPTIIIGDLDLCSRSSILTPTIHACKDPCHRAACGHYQGSLPPHHPNYLTYLNPHADQLHLNMIDPPKPLFHPDLFTTALHFLDRHLAEPNGLVLVHCNKGLSRAPSIALLWLATRGHLHANEPQRPTTFHDAADTFIRAYMPAYDPGRGIVLFLTSHWTEPDWWPRPPDAP